MLLQNHEIDGASTWIKSHGHHHRGTQRPPEEVVLCTVYHFPEPKEAMKRLQAQFPHVRFIWHTLDDLSCTSHGEVIPEGENAQSLGHSTLPRFSSVNGIANQSRLALSGLPRRHDLPHIQPFTSIAPANA